MSRAWNSLWRDQRRAGWLMSGYFLLSLVTGPIIYLRAGPAPLAPGPGSLGWVFSAFFAWRVTRGGRVSRVLLIVGAVLSCLAAASMVALRFTPAALGVLAAGGVQAAVLLSPAVYQRTRPGGGTARTGEPAGPQPQRQRRRSPRWLVTVLAVAAALGLTGSAVAEPAVPAHAGLHRSYPGTGPDLAQRQPWPARVHRAVGAGAAVPDPLDRGRCRIRAAPARRAGGAGLDLSPSGTVLSMFLLCA